MGDQTSRRNRPDSSNTAEDAVGVLRAAALAESTTESYAWSWRKFVRWCENRGLDPQVPEARQLVAWLHGRWDLRPATLNSNANAVCRALAEVGHPDVRLDGDLNRLLAAHRRFHGDKPDPALVSVALSREDLVAMVGATFAGGGHATPATIDRGAVAALLCSEGIPLAQTTRITVDAVSSGDRHVLVVVPPLQGKGVPVRRAASGFIMELPITGDELCATALVRTAAVPIERSLLLAFGPQHAGTGQHSTPKLVPVCDQPGRLCERLGRQVRNAAARAGLELRHPDELATWDLVDVRRLIRHLNPSYLLELRTRMHFAVLVALGCRHSDTVAMPVERMRRRPEGIEVVITRSKTDQDGAGVARVVPHTPGHPVTCPACLVERWLDDTRITCGPLLRALGPGGEVKDTAVAVQEASGELKRLALRLGIDGNVGTHSGRKTHATLRAAAGEEAWEIAADTGQTPETVLRSYVQPQNPFDAAAQL